MEVKKFENFYKIYADEGKILATKDGERLTSMVIIPLNEKLLNDYIEIDEPTELDKNWEDVYEEAERSPDKDAFMNSYLETNSVIKENVLKINDNIDSLKSENAHQNRVIDNMMMDILDLMYPDLGDVEDFNKLKNKLNKKDKE